MGDVQDRLYFPGAMGGERWELEADPRQVEILVSQMGLQSCECSWCADN